jgi:hypothetical protein
MHLAIMRICVPFMLQAQVFTGLSSSDFTQALAMCGLAVFAARRLQASPLRQPEQQVAAFLSHLGLPPLPGQQQLLAGAGGAAAGAAAAGTGGGSAHQKAGSFKRESSSKEGANFQCIAPDAGGRAFQAMVPV